MIRILSTRILAPRQKEIFPDQGFHLEEYNAIHIAFRKFVLDLEPDNYILTSQNAVRGLLRAIDELPLPEKRIEARAKTCFCVGSKTAGLLEENGLKVKKTAKNSKELAEFIAKSHKNETFLFICGNRRREDLPAILKENTVQYKEIIAYDTQSRHQPFKTAFDGVLFFSPSGVQSYTALNDLSKSTAFCIGTSTEHEALQHTSNTIVASEQRIESVIESSVNYFNPNL